jgi:hypothetical protein
LGTVGKNRVKKSSRWKYRALNQSEVSGNIPEILSDNTGMANNCSGHLVTPRIKAGKDGIPKKISALVCGFTPWDTLSLFSQNIPNLLVVLTLMKKFRGVGSPTIKRMTWL